MRRETINIILLGLGFCLIWGAMNAQAFICDPVLVVFHEIDSKIPENYGFTMFISYFCLIIFSRQAYTNCVFTIGNFIVPPIVAILGSKWSLVLGGLGAPISMIGFEIVNIYPITLIAIITGFAIGIMWGAMGEYVALNSTETDVERNSGIVWMATMFSNVVSGVFLLIMFAFNPENTYTLRLIRILFVGLFVVASIGTLCLISLQSKKNPTSSKIRSPLNDSWTELKATFGLLFTRDFSLLLPISYFSGLEMGIITVTYPTAVQFTDAFNFNNQILVALVSIVMGFGEVVAGVPLSFLNLKRFSYSFLINSACLICCLYSAMVYVTIPSEAGLKETNATSYFQPNVSVALFSSLLMGMVDATVNVLLLAYICRKYEEKETTIAYSLKNLLSGLGMTIGMFYGAVLSLDWQLLILVIFALLSAVTFTISERLWREKKKMEGKKSISGSSSSSLSELT